MTKITVSASRLEGVIYLFKMEGYEFENIENEIAEATNWCGFAFGRNVVYWVVGSVDYDELESELEDFANRLNESVAKKGIEFEFEFDI